jgi:uncharacterized protein
MTGTDPPITRRDALSLLALGLSALVDPRRGGGQGRVVREVPRSPTGPAYVRGPDPNAGATMQVHYIEIVTPDVDPTCALHSALHGVGFGDADPNLGGARTARLASGGLLGVRAPMHDGERPVVRPYILVENLEDAVTAASAAGAEIIVPPMELPGHGRCALLHQGGIESGLWQH